MTQKDYIKLSDFELVDMFNSSNDIYALYLLVCERHRDKIKKTIGAQLTSGYDTQDLDSMITEFYLHMAEPTKKSGKSRLANYNRESDFAPYISSCVRNFIADRQKVEKDKNLFIVNIDNPESQAAPLIANDDKESKEFKRMQYLSLLLTLESIDQGNSTRDQYIWLTHILNCSMLAKNPHDESVYPQLAEQLGLNQATVKQASKRMKDKITKKTKIILSELVTEKADHSIGSED